MLDRIPPPLRAPILGSGLGAVAGGFEMVAMGATLSLHLGFGDAALLGLVTVLLGGLVGAALALPVGLGLALLTRNWLPATRHAAGMAATAGLLGWWYLVPIGLFKIDQGLVPAGIAFFLTPIGIIGVTWFNAHYWFRREDLGERRRFGWWAVSLVMGLLLAMAGAGWLSGRDYGGRNALEGDPSVLLITVDGLPATALEESEAAVGTLAQEGVRYTNAITPSPRLRPAHAAILSGRHPVRVDVVEEDDALAWGYETLTERLAAEGYATGAFVSSSILSEDAGLSQGFEVYDADLEPALKGLSEVALVEVGRKLLGGAEARSGEETVDRLRAWLPAVGNKPFFAWVQLPDSNAVEIQVGALLEAARAQEQPLIVVLVGTRGAAAEDPLSEQAIRVPLIILPHQIREKTRSIPQQVRLMDVPASILDRLRLDPMEQSEGVDLLSYAEGLIDRHLSSLLVYKDGERLLLGYRAARKDETGAETGNIKYRFDPASEESRLYDLVTDPTESTDIAGQQPQVVEALKARVLEEAGELLR